MTDLADLTARVERLLASDRLTEPTRAALRSRLERRYGAPQRLSAIQMATLRAASARLIPGAELAEAVDLAGAFDARLAEGDGDGWRYAELAPDAALHPQGLDILAAAAQRRFALSFETLQPLHQDELLQAAIDGQLEEAERFDTARWMEELLSGLVELHYAHPLVQIEIGYDGMADAHGVQAVSLAEVEEEARLAD